MKSLIFKFDITPSQSKQLLESTKSDEAYFRRLVGLGVEMQKLVNEDDLPSLQAFFNKHITSIPFIRIFIDEAFEQAILYRYIEILQYFVSNGYTVSSPQLLIVLIMTSRFLRNDPPIEILELLLNNGLTADCCTDDKFRTPLSLSCRFGIIEFIKFLIERGADLNATDKKRMTPLMQLQKAQTKYKGLEQMIEYVKQKGGQVFERITD